MFLRSIILLILLLVMNNVGNAQISGNELKLLLEKARKKFDIPGLAVVLSSSNGIIAYETAGVQVRGTSKAINKNDFFHIGSTSKSILACLTGKLAEEGKINWNTKIFDVFPELKESSNPEFYQITLEDLFLCKAGIMAFTSPLDSYPDINSSIVDKRYEFCKWLLKQQASTQKDKFGKFPHLYSNASYTLIAVVLERISGLSYEALLDNFLAKDLQVQHIFGWPNELEEDQPWGHGSFSADSNGTLFNSKELIAFEPGSSYKLNELIRPAGDISMKPLDFAKYTQVHLKNLRGLDFILKSQTIKHIDLAHNGFSLGVYNGKSTGKEFVGFDGSAGTFYCRGFIIPKDDLTLTIMFNCGNTKAADWLTIKVLKNYYNWGWKFWL